MKQYIYIFLTIFFLSTIVYSQNNNRSVEGTINGRDLTKCGCCGGWIIEIDGHKFLTDSIPNASGILGPNYKRKYPIKIYLDYKMKPGHCKNRIIITFIIKR